MVGTRSLEDSEIENLRSRLWGDLAASRRQRLLLGLGWATVFVASLAFVLWIREETDVAPLLSFVLLFAVVAAGLAGALLAVVFPRKRWHRWLFLIGFVGWALGATGAGPEWLAILLAFLSVIVLGVGGPVYLWTGWRRERALAPVLRAVATDLRRGRVMVFRSTSTGDEAEVLPQSRVLWRFAGVETGTWETVECRRVADRDGEFETLAPEDAPAPLRDHVYRLGRRPLGPKERAELQRHVGRIPRRIVTELLAVALVAAALARFVEWLSRDSIDDGLSTAALVAVGLIVTGRAFLRLRERTRLKADLQNGFVLRVRRPPDADPDDPLHAEVLPLSGVVWTAEDRPSPWRSS
jgi:hypothetical protein